MLSCFVDRSRGGRRQCWALLLGAILGVAGLAPPAWAAALAPGGNVAPTSLALPANTLLDTTSVAFSGTNGTESYTGTLTAEVRRNTGTGTLIFTYSFTNTGPLPGQVAQAITDLIVTGYAGFTTDVNFVPLSGVPAGTNNPGSVDRSAGGGTVTFNFTPPASTSIGSGETSATVWIQTNATIYVSGTAQVTDGFASNIMTVFAPGAPEPGTLTLAFIGAVPLLGMVRRWRKRRGEAGANPLAPTGV